MIDFFSIVASFIYSNKRTFCSVCDNTDVRFSPLPDYYRNNAIKYGYPYYGKGEMTALKTYSCLNCGASDRERLYAYWIGLQNNTNILSNNSRIIHFAPEVALSSKLKTLNRGTYHTADLLMDGCDFKVDMIDLPFDNESYDFFICSHVLEHIESDDMAISELYRITKKGGCGILMSPIILGLKDTLENRSITSEAERWRNFGQNDHVRLYAHDAYIRKIKKHGFSVQELGRRYFGFEIFVRLGLKISSILYVVNK
jgi:SAM-dependent methyltransferase